MHIDCDALVQLFWHRFSVDPTSLAPGESLERRACIADNTWMMQRGDPDSLSPPSMDYVRLTMTLDPLSEETYDAILFPQGCTIENWQVNSSIDVEIAKKVSRAKKRHIRGKIWV